MKGKKGGWYFSAFFVLVLLILLGVALVTVYSKTDISRDFGDLPKTILETYHNGEKILFYVDYSSKHSIYQVEYQLGQKGGFYESDCGDYLGYSLWQDCYPERDLLKDSFGSYLNIHLNNYLLNYPQEDIAFPLNNYDFLIKDDKIVGIATENIEFDVKENG